MEPIRTTLTSEEADRLLLRILSEPTRAWTFLRSVADKLDKNPFLVMNHGLQTDALNAAAAETLAGLPEIVAAEATMAAMDELPLFVPGTELAGDYAARIRNAAEVLR